jgi:hypothetical protein
LVYGGVLALSSASILPQGEKIVSNPSRSLATVLSPEICFNKTYSAANVNKGQYENRHYSESCGNCLADGCYYCVEPDYSNNYCYDPKNTTNNVYKPCKGDILSPKEGESIRDTCEFQNMPLAVVVLLIIFWILCPICFCGAVVSFVCHTIRKDKHTQQRVVPIGYHSAPGHYPTHEHGSGQAVMMHQPNMPSQRSPYLELPIHIDAQYVQTQQERDVIKIDPAEASETAAGAAAAGHSSTAGGASEVKREEVPTAHAEAVYLP